MITAYLYSRCSTCRTAESILRDSGRPFTARDLFEEPLSRTELDELFTSIGSTPREMLSTRSIPYRELGLAEKNPGDGELLDLMAEYPALIRRPIVVIDGQAQIGLNQPALQAALGITKDKA
jgi:regulatory protein spx